MEIMEHHASSIAQKHHDQRETLVVIIYQKVKHLVAKEVSLLKAEVLHSENHVPISIQQLNQ